MDHDCNAAPMKAEIIEGVNSPCDVLITNELGDSCTQVGCMEVVHSTTCDTSHKNGSNEHALHLALGSIMPTKSEEDILRRHLLDLKKQGNMWTGYAPSREAFVDLQQDLAGINMCFQTQHSVKSKGRFLFSNQRGYIIINEDMPFRVVRNAIKGCLFGLEPRKLQESRSKQESGLGCSEATFKKRKVKPQRTRKKGCTAVMHVKHVEMYPQFKVNLSDKRKKWARKAASRKALTQLKLALQEEANGKPVARQHRFYISMSDAKSHHNHDIGTDCAGFALPVNSEVAKKIAQLVQEGVTSVKTVESCLKSYVTDVLFANRQHPSLARRDFYPTRANIKNHIHRALRKYRSCPANKKDAAAYVELLQEKAPSTSCLFHISVVETVEAYSPEQDEQQVLSADTDVSYRNGPCLDVPIDRVDGGSEALSEMEDCEQMVGDDVEDHASDWSRTSQQSTPNVKLQTGSDSTQVLYFPSFNLSSQVLPSETLSAAEDCEQLAEEGVEYHASRSLMASRQNICGIKTQIRTELTELLSCLHHVHDHTALQWLLFLLTEARNLARANMVTSSESDVTDSPEDSMGARNQKEEMNTTITS